MREQEPPIHDRQPERDSGSIRNGVAIVGSLAILTFVAWHPETVEGIMRSDTPSAVAEATPQPTDVVAPPSDVSPEPTKTIRKAVKVSGHRKVVKVTDHTVKKADQPHTTLRKPVKVINNQPIAVGEHSLRVKVMQNMLQSMQCGDIKKIDGIFSKDGATQQAVLHFEGNHGIPQLGIPYAFVQNRIREAYRNKEKNCGGPATQVGNPDKIQ